jgi:hypothetical protein
VRERQVRDDAERLSRQRQAQSVAVHDPDGRTSSESLPQSCCKNRIELGRDHASGAASEFEREDARARTDLDDEVAARQPCIPDEVSGEARDEEVLTPSGT